MEAYYATKLACPCERITLTWYRLAKQLTTQALTARKCGCNYCQAHKAEYISLANSIVKADLHIPTGHNISQHGYRTADFHECIDCGLVMVVSNIEGQDRCVLNANVLNIDNYKLDNNISDFSKESKQQRLQRRKNNWCKFISG